MRFGLVAEFVEVGRALQAEERMEAIVDAAVAAGTLKPGARRSHIRGLERQADRRGIAIREEPDSEAKPRLSREKRKAALAAFGIDVVAESK